MLYDKRWDADKQVDEAGALLLAAAEHIERHGWCQGAFHRGERSCPKGALLDLNVKDPSFDLYALAVKRLTALIRDSHGNRDLCIEVWNDDEMRTKECVVRTMREAAMMR